MALALLMSLPALVVAAVLMSGGYPDPGVAGAALKAKKVVVLGKSGGMPKPACPAKCQVVASVTGFQSSIPGRQVPMEVPFNGRITGWKIFLGKPSKRDRKLLTDRWGSPPQASLVILQKRSSGGKVEYKLKRRSPTVSLGGKLGKSPFIELKQPLRVVKGDQVGLAVPTWIPAFAGGLNRKRNSWRAGRAPGKCNAANQTGTAQTKVGSSRPYGCRYAGGRLLYQARLERK